MDGHVRDWLLNLFNKLYSNQNVLNNKLDYIIGVLNKQGNNNVLNNPPLKNITPKQMYLAYKSSWSLHDIATISGTTTDDVKKKIEKYITDNV